MDWYYLRKKIIAYVKNEGSNLNATTNVLKSVICCEILGLEESFQGYCFGPTFSKACQYAIVEDKVCKNVKEMSIIFT